MIMLFMILVVGVGMLVCYVLLAPLTLSPLKISSGLKRASKEQTSASTGTFISYDYLEHCMNALGRPSDCYGHMPGGHWYYSLLGKLFVAYEVKGGPKLRFSLERQYLANGQSLASFMEQEGETGTDTSSASPRRSRKKRVSRSKKRSGWRARSTEGLRKDLSRKRKS